MLRVLGWRCSGIPTMVQRGYYASTKILVEDFFPSNWLSFFKVPPYCFFGPPVPSLPFLLI